MATYGEVYHLSRADAEAAVGSFPEQWDTLRKALQEAVTSNMVANEAVAKNLLYAGVSSESLLASQC